MNTRPYITILGGGPAGLAIGYFARKRGISFTIHEATDRLGGNAITLQRGAFRFDSGAHRFHDKDHRVTREIKALLGDDLIEINLPGKILSGDRLINFPPSPLNLTTQVGIPVMVKAALEILSTRLVPRNSDGSFQSFCIHRYGKTLAEMFLLNYTEKLWGLPARQLSPNISGARLRGLDISTLFKETLLGRKARSRHLDGVFYYPALGYGMIVEKLSQFCGPENIHTNSRITKVFHDHRRIQAIEINASEQHEVQEVASTLPMPLFLSLMEPRLEPSILAMADELRFRNVLIVALFLDRERVTPYASIYFPSREIPFTRIYEPKNRSAAMAPPRQTSLCAEIPCFEEDVLWQEDDGSLIEKVVSSLVQMDWIDRGEILDACVLRMPRAYPILELNTERAVDHLYATLARYENLKITGRNGMHAYKHVHDLIGYGMQLVDGYASEMIGQNAPVHNASPA